MAGLVIEEAWGMLLGERFRSALVYAAELHADQVRKSTTIPYVSHLLIVAGTVIDWGGDEDQAIAALLHDAIEDQGGAEIRRQIADRFGERVAEMVSALSGTDQEPKPPWLERKRAYLERLASEPVEVLLISLADKLHNARAILRDHKEVGDALWDRFNAKDPARHLWYYREALKVYDRRLPERLTSELRVVVEELAARTDIDLEHISDPA